MSSGSILNDTKDSSLWPSTVQEPSAWRPPPLPVHFVEAAPAPEGTPLLPIRFVEVCAGRGTLSRWVARAGVSVEPPQDAGTGGYDLLDPAGREALLRRWKELLRTHRIVVHFAPPCSTFTFARNRSGRTRLRSP